VNASQALVIAGGPVMDLPRVLLKHLVAANAARRGRKPLIVERVGIGPFRRTVSRCAARLLLRRASALTTRTIAASKDPIVAGLPVGVGRDPAFDYLTPRDHLSRLTSRERDSVDELLAGTDGHIVVGINVRPIGHSWSQKGSIYARNAEDQFIEALASSISRFSVSAPQRVTFVAFPMNPIQFGRSDLASAFRIHRAVGPAADFRVWEADPDVDGMLYLLRHCHAVIGVRFHACIFALSQGVPTIGADYYPGGGGKVQDLFRDLGKPDDVRVMDEITSEWLEARLQVAVRAPNRHARPWRSSTPPSGNLERQS
jgi:polysaccharide pyruvyl transferase WcaK-like protein